MYPSAHAHAALQPSTVLLHQQPQSASPNSCAQPLPMPVPNRCLSPPCPNLHPFLWRSHCFNRHFLTFILSNDLDPACCLPVLTPGMLQHAIIHLPPLRSGGYRGEYSKGGVQQGRVDCTKRRGYWVVKQQKQQAAGSTTGLSASKHKSSTQASMKEGVSRP